MAEDLCDMQKTRFVKRLGKLLGSGEVIFQVMPIHQYGVQVTIYLTLS